MSQSRHILQNLSQICRLSFLSPQSNRQRSKRVQPKRISMMQIKTQTRLFLNSMLAFRTTTKSKASNLQTNLLKLNLQERPLTLLFKCWSASRTRMSPPNAKTHPNCFQNRPNGTPSQLTRILRQRRASLCHSNSAPSTTFYRSRTN